MDDDYDHDGFDDGGRSLHQGHAMPRQRVPARKPRSRSLILILGVAGVVLIGAVGAWAYLTGEDYLGGEELPVITADRSPYKVRPEEPGGMEVPNQDKEIYERVAGQDGEQVERLLPPAEEAEPPANTAATAGEGTEKMAETAENMAAEAKPGEDLQPPPPPPVQDEAEKAAAMADEKAGELAKSAEDAAGAETKSLSDSDQTAQVSREELPPPPDAKTEENPTSTTDATSDANSDATTTEQPAATETPTETPAAPGGGDYRVQVASIQDRSKAESSWSAMQGKHEDLLGGLTLTIVEVEIEGRGTFYRLQGGGVSRARAEEICATLKQRNAGCLIVRP